tara:strand:- start:24 stop:170 length:147 start_codon:yes stop_codon:yes gene_type:complete
MARTKSREMRWKYILLLQSGGAFFGDTLWAVVKQMFGAWRMRGKQWAD